MDLTVLLPLGAALGLGLLADRLARMLAPATAARVLTGAAVATAVATLELLTVEAAAAVGALPAVSGRLHWSAATVAVAGGLPSGWASRLGWLSAGLLAAAVGSAARSAFVAVRALAAARRLCRELGPDAAGLVVLPDDRPDAYSVPGRDGRIVVTAGMFRALDAPGRRVLLAHEESHLRNRHHAYVQLCGLAGSANPLLLPLTGVVAAAVERWADEDAAAVVPARSIAARALARAGVVRSTLPPTPPIPTAALEVCRRDGRDVVHRARALLDGPPASRRWVAALVLAVTVWMLAATAELGGDAWAKVQQARQEAVLAR